MLRCESRPQIKQETITEIMSDHHIIDQVLAGLERPRAAHVVEDREAAIRAAIGLAGPDDVVVLAGKGHEQGQIFRDRTAPFDDRFVARRVLAELRPRAAA